MGDASWCPRCGAEYRPGYTECVDCGVALVGEPPPASSQEPGRFDESARHEPAAYDLSDWPAESRQALEWMLGGLDIAFEWDAGSVLVVPPTRAEEVEGFIDYLESGAADGNAEDEDWEADQDEVETETETQEDPESVDPAAGSSSSGLDDRPSPWWPA